MINLFKKRVQHKSSTKFDPVICRVKVFNKAINSPVTVVDFKLSEKILIGGFKSQYPTSIYHIEIINF